MTQFNLVNEPSGPDPKRLLIAVMLTSAVLVSYSYFFPPAPMPAQVAEQKADTKPAATEPAPVPTPSAAALGHPLATPADLPAQEITFGVDDEQSRQNRTSYQATITSRGGALSKYLLTGFSKERELINQDKNGSFMLRLVSKSPSISLNENSPYQVVSRDQTHLTLGHVTKEGLSIERRYEFLKNDTIKEQIKLKNLSPNALQVDLALTSVKVDNKGAEPGLLNPGVQSDSLIVKSGEKHERFALNDVLDKPKVVTSPKYAAFDHQFFLAAIMPKISTDFNRVEVVANEVGSEQRKSSIEFHLNPLVLAFDQEKVLEHQLFLGPKQVDLLASITPPLDENIDFGWFGALSRPMLWLLVQIYNFVLNYGLAIILITFIIKLLTYPLTHKSFASQQEMKKIAPKIKELQAKYSHDRTLLGQKQMELYKQYGINPVAGCLPMLIQLPIWFAFFQMLRNSVELFDQPFYGWITDLTMPDRFMVLPILMGVSMMIQQAFTPPPSDQPQMKYVMWAMPVFLTLIMLNMPSGLSLYILTNNLLTIVQQMIIKRQSDRSERLA